MHKAACDWAKNPSLLNKHTWSRLLLHIWLRIPTVCFQTSEWIHFWAWMKSQTEEQQTGTGGVGNKILHMFVFVHCLSSILAFAECKPRWLFIGFWSLNICWFVAPLELLPTANCPLVQQSHSSNTGHSFSSVASATAPCHLVSILSLAFLCLFTPLLLKLLNHKELRLHPLQLKTLATDGIPQEAHDPINLFTFNSFNSSST